MKNLLGLDVDDSKYFEDIKSRKPIETIKQQFRRVHGYKKDYKCKNCSFFLEGRYRNKKYFKCRKLGLSHSEATDIRKSDVACNLYQESESE